MKSRILLVEDAADVQLIVADLLRGNGHEVVVSGDGEEALRVVMEQPFDLMILDVMLPRLSGFDLCRTVREHGFDGAIIMVTARAHVDDRVEGLHTGADDYLVKPFDPKEPLARVGAMLRRLGKTPLTPVLRYQFGDVTVDFSRESRGKGVAVVTIPDRSSRPSGFPRPTAIPHLARPTLYRPSHRGRSRCVAPAKAGTESASPSSHCHGARRGLLFRTIASSSSTPTGSGSRR